MVREASLLRDLGYHIFKLTHAFLEAYDGDRLTGSMLGGTAPESMQTAGDLAAYGQTNIKRLLAYSTIAHAGYMMMPVAALMVLVPLQPSAAQDAVSAIAIYIGVYLFMNLGAFAIVAFLRNAMRSEEIADYAGLIRRCPVTVICFSLILFGLMSAGTFFVPGLKFYRLQRRKG